MSSSVRDLCEVMFYLDDKIPSCETDRSAEDARYKNSMILDAMSAPTVDLQVHYAKEAMKRLLHWYGELLTDENQLQLIESSVVAATTIADVSISMIHLISCIKWANVDALFPPFQHESYNITFHIASYYYKVLGFQEHLQAAELYADPLTQMFKNFDQLWNLEDESISPALAGFCPMTPAGILGNAKDIAFYTVGASWSDVDFIDVTSEKKSKDGTLYVAAEPWERLKESFLKSKPVLVTALANYLRWRAEHELTYYPSRSWLSETWAIRNILMKKYLPVHRDVTQAHFDEIFVGATPPFNQMTQEHIGVLRNSTTHHFWEIVSKTPSPILILMFHVSTTSNLKDETEGDYSKLSGVSAVASIPFMRPAYYVKMYSKQCSATGPKWDLWCQKVSPPGREQLDTWIFVAKGFQRCFHPVVNSETREAISTILFQCAQGGTTFWRSLYAKAPRSPAVATAAADPQA